MRVLVIDDEAEILMMVAKALSRNGYEAITVSNLHDAAKMIRNNKWDLIITDVMIPYAGGFELVEDIKSNSSTPVIMMTGMSEDILKTTINKADRILHKPFSSEELIKAAREFTSEKTL